MQDGDGVLKNEDDQGLGNEATTVLTAEISFVVRRSRSDVFFSFFFPFLVGIVLGFLFSLYEQKERDVQIHMLLLYLHRS